MSTAECPICFESFALLEDGVFFVACGHCICTECSRQRQWDRCPTCRTHAGIPPFRRIFVQTSPQGSVSAALEEQRAALAAYVDQLTARVQALESEMTRFEDESTRLTVRLQQTQGDLRAAEGRERCQKEEILELGDWLSVYADLKNYWTRRTIALQSDSEALKRDVGARDKTIQSLKEQNRTLTAKLDRYEGRTWVSRWNSLAGPARRSSGRRPGGGTELDNAGDTLHVEHAISPATSGRVPNLTKSHLFVANATPASGAKLDAERFLRVGDAGESETECRVYGGRGMRMVEWFRSISTKADSVRAGCGIEDEWVITGVVSACSKEQRSWPTATSTRARAMSLIVVAATAILGDTCMSCLLPFLALGLCTSDAPRFELGLKCGIRRCTLCRQVILEQREEIGPEGGLGNDGVTIV
ncbi:uncharacterized protein SCHCODRAFT_02509796 [Schizophyllum commune H4-8]|uniref:RING-type domain-containing protein n=1 Tax=Schizophyllum commune (strain H4-8 / FGSC 9210) TaxID=578458 RepID=D8QB96_SCHCM|nr:uncharacterized protein SCHCODRAFT_02509796 [Schizophyllum commune H4-8]KAI5889085.1 hypothetical protein SCHCODRAFT_02509796 [Schizophyllum commune H4-8]